VIALCDDLCIFPSGWVAKQEVAHCAGGQKEGELRERQGERRNRSVQKQKGCGDMPQPLAAMLVASEPVPDCATFEDPESW
jgi:hypothetical protein